VSKSKEDYTRAQWQIDAHGFWRSSGDRFLTKNELAQIPVGKLQNVYRKFSRNAVYDYVEHVELAKKLDEDNKLPASFMVVAPGSWSDEVWDDILRMRTLNAEQKRRDLQMHVCPLQLDIVERLINRYTNEGDTILDFFGGIGTVALTAMKLNRYGYTIELNNDYFRDSLGYLKNQDEKIEQPTLFDFEESEEK
jgi:DNA modification methylase